MIYFKVVSADHGLVQAYCTLSGEVMLFQVKPLSLAVRRHITSLVSR
jgi:hypothetical protein